MSTKAEDTLKKYDKLNKSEIYDKEAAEELAEAMNERFELSKRAAVLTDLINENEDLQTFVWTTKEGVSQALHDLEDDHLKNILLYHLDRGVAISKSVKAEARKRGFEIPTQDDLVAGRLDAYERAKSLAPGQMQTYGPPF